MLPRKEIQTAQEFLAEQAALIQEAGDVLDCEIDACSYAKGYIRQRVFSCLTCSREGGDGHIGVCYGCFVSCHTDHDVVELDFKRSFRCDCGASKSPAPCALKKGLPVEDSTLNVYNHNFNGTFCHCAIPFSVEDQDEEDTTMVQCLVCEDWFHDRCLSQTLPETFDDYVCKTCVSKHSFLRSYRHISPHNFILAKKSLENATEIPSSVEKTGCKLDNAPSTNQDSSFSLDVDLFLLDNWRESLCQCVSCLEMYKRNGVSFLLEPEEETYEPPVDPRARLDPYDLATQALESMDRVQAIEGVRMYSKLRDDLMDFLKPYAESKNVVSEEDIRAFFIAKEEERLAKREKRRRLE